MNKVKISIIFLVLFFFTGFMNGQSKVSEPSKSGPVPSENQLRWHEMEYYAFVHFSLNTYTDQIWGYGNEDLSLFNPEKLDCRQWARVCKEAGMKGIIVTAKHCGGFCLWPSKFTEYSVKNTPWKNGKGDVIRELADACKEYDLKLGIYLSPWDRNRKDYGSSEYITYFRNQLTELMSNYGDIFEIWFDGANGGDGYYGGTEGSRKIDRYTYYDWPNTYSLVRKLQPKIVLWGDGGDRADLRWVGTEDGYVGETNWSLLDSTGLVTWDMLHYGLENGNAWVPAEVNTSTRPEWFYHQSEDNKVKSVNQLLDLYYNSIGRNGSLLLNFPITPDGLIHENDERAVLEFAKMIKESFKENLAQKASLKATNTRGDDADYLPIKVVDGDKKTYWATDDNVKSATLTIEFTTPVSFNRFLVQEFIPLGQRVKSFNIEALVDNKWIELAHATTIGYKRILRFPVVTTTHLRFNILDSKSCPLISEIGVYNAPMVLDAPVVRRNQLGEITIVSKDQGSVIYYTLDGSAPSIHSLIYSAPFVNEGKVEVKAMAYDPSSKKASPITTEGYDLCRKDWTVLGVNDPKVNSILDGNPESAWCFNNDQNQPAEIVIDLGSYQSLCGFKYLPDQSRWPCPHVTKYQFYVSQDNIKWTMVSDGNFSNIKNNPLVQVVTFGVVKARYFKLRAMGNTNGTLNQAGCADIEVITR